MTQSSQRITNEGLTISMRTMGTTVAESVFEIWRVGDGSSSLMRV